jgi:hypothetical protein
VQLKNSKETKAKAPGKDGLEEMALRILCNGAVKKDLLFEHKRARECEGYQRSCEFKSFQRNAVKFSQFPHSLELLVLLVQAKSTFKKAF